MGLLGNKMSMWLIIRWFRDFYNLLEQNELFPVEVIQQIILYVLESQLLSPVHSHSIEMKTKHLYHVARFTACKDLLLLEFAQ